MANYGAGAWGADRDQLSPQQHILLRLGSRVTLDRLPSLPEHYRARESQSHGRLGQVMLQAATGAIWCRLDGELGGQVWPPGIMWTEPRTLALRKDQAPTPPPDALVLYPHMVIEGQDSAYGKLEGIVVMAATGLAASLLVRIRDNLTDVVAGPGDPLASLLRVAGREVMVAVDWAQAPESTAHFQGTDQHLLLDATPAQVAHGLLLRDDRAILQDVWNILGESRALASYYQQLRVEVQDGEVTISGPTLSPRLRASLEQDIWHVSGVLALHSRFTES